MKAAGDTFAAGAARLAGLAAALLGWRPDDFWRSTPAELATVLRALRGPEAEPAGAADIARLMAAEALREGVSDG